MEMEIPCLDKSFYEKNGREILYFYTFPSKGYL